MRYWFLDEGSIERVSAFLPGRLDSHHTDGTHVAMGDGAVRFLSKSLARHTLLSLLGRQDALRYEIEADQD